MPDPNKFDVLRKIGYTVRGTCSTCVHGQFASGQAWGLCGLHKYQHQRQSNPAEGRGVSIINVGFCSDCVLDENKIQLGAHQEFLCPKNS